MWWCVDVVVVVCVVLKGVEGVWYGRYLAELVSSQAR